MPELIEHVDAIARQRGRDVLYVEFPCAGDYRTNPARAALLAWLAEHGYGWRPCGPYARPGFMPAYRGQICLDLPFDEDLPSYRSLRDHLEFPDGNMRNPAVRFYLLTLDLAMRNAAHDAPDFWTRWAEQF